MTSRTCEVLLDDYPSYLLVAGSNGVFPQQNDAAAELDLTAPTRSLGLRSLHQRLYYVDAFVLCTLL
jgi:hypothetical protein